jgi:outer membrane receptor protein involved in Fe transport
MGVSYFHSRQTHSLVIVDTGKPRLEYMNVGEATFRGIEFEGKAYLTKNLFLDGSFLHQVNEERRAEVRRPANRRRSIQGRALD